MRAIRELPIASSSTCVSTAHDLAALFPRLTIFGPLSGDSLARGHRLIQVRWAPAGWRCLQCLSSKHSLVSRISLFLDSTISQCSSDAVAVVLRADRITTQPSHGVVQWQHGCS